MCLPWRRTVWNSTSILIEPNSIPIVCPAKPTWNLSPKCSQPQESYQSWRTFLQLRKFSLLNPSLKMILPWWVHNLKISDLIGESWILVPTVKTTWHAINWIIHLLVFDTYIYMIPTPEIWSKWHCVDACFLSDEFIHWEDCKCNNWNQSGA